jgi:S1-C subfamily serine protease
MSNNNGDKYLHGVTLHSKGEFLMRFSINIVWMAIALVLSGCVSQQDANNLDQYWAAENDKLIKVFGTKTFKIKPLLAHRAMMLTLTDLGMIIENQNIDSGFIVAMSNAPRPLSDREWAQISAAALPAVQRYLGPFAGLNAKNTEVIINAIIVPRGNEVQINLRLKTKYTGPTAGLIIGEQAPPMAIKIGLEKIWKKFQRTVIAEEKNIARDFASKKVKPENIDRNSQPPPVKKKSKTLPTARSSGSGFFISKLGHILTNQHVINKCQRVTVGDNAKTYIRATVLETDQRNDLALLRISTTEIASAETKSLITKHGIAVVPLATQGLLRSKEVELGERVMVSGYPYGDIFSNTIKVTGGMISANRGVGDDTGQFQMDAAVQPGNSGGPIYDEYGNIVGVVVAQLNKLKIAKAIGSLPENVNFGIKASTVRQFLNASGLPTKWSKRSKSMSTRDLAKIAKIQTVMVVCYR